jgi:hypothetical protein
MAIAMNLLQSQVGLNLKTSKCCFRPSQQFLCLGFMWDTTAMTASVPRARLWETQRTARRLAKHEQRPILTRDLARIVGKITAMTRGIRGARRYISAARTTGTEQHRQTGGIRGQDTPHRPRRGGPAMVGGTRPVDPERRLDRPRDPTPPGQRPERRRHRDPRLGRDPDNGRATHAINAGVLYGAGARFAHQRARAPGMLAHHPGTPPGGPAKGQMERRAPFLQTR